MCAATKLYKVEREKSEKSSGLGGCNGAPNVLLTCENLDPLQQKRASHQVLFAVSGNF